MDFTLSPEVDGLRRRLRDFVEAEIMPLEADPAAYDAHENIAPARLEALREKARAQGLWALQMPKARGGQGLKVAEMAVCYEEMGRSIFGPVVFNCAAPDDGNMILLEKVATAAQKERWLQPIVDGKVRSAFAMTEPAPGAGSDPGLMLSHARRDGDHWVLNGRKIFITNAPYAHHAVVFARAPKGITAFIVDTDTPGFQIGQVFDTLGHKGSAICELVFEDCRIPASALLGEEGKGFDIAKRSLSEGRTMLSARSVGAAQKAMELAIEHGEARQTFGKPLLDHQALAFRLAQMSARTEAARMLVYRSAWLIDRGSPAIRESSTAKYFCGEALWQTVDDAIQMLGGYGYIRGEYMLDRIWRDARVVRIYDGSSEVQQILIAQRLRKGDLETPW